MAGVAFAVEGDGVGFATESYAASALYTTLANLSAALWRIRRAKAHELRDRAESLLRMARETTDKREREVLGRLAAENLAKAEELEASMDHGAPTLQSGSQQSS
jgi:ribosomal protein L17